MLPFTNGFDAPIRDRGSAFPTFLLDDHTRVCHDACCLGELEIACRPMAAVEINVASALWFSTGIRIPKVKRLKAANPSFTDPPTGTYVSRSGSGEIDTACNRDERRWTSFANPRFPESSDSPNLDLLKFVPDIAEYWDAPDSTMVRASGMLASIVAGRPLAMEQHSLHTGLSAGPSETGVTS